MKVDEIKKIHGYQSMASREASIDLWHEHYENHGRWPWNDGLATRDNEYLPAPSECPPVPLMLAELQRLEEADRKLASIEKEFERLPRWVKHRYSDGLADAAAVSRVQANNYLLKEIDKGLLPRIRLVNDQYLIEGSTTTARMFRGYIRRLPHYRRDEIKKLAFRIAAHFDGAFSRLYEHLSAVDNAFVSMTVNTCYQYLGRLTRSLRIDAPFWPLFESGELSADDAAAGIARMIDTKWWNKKLSRLAEVWREHLAIAAGLVHKHASPYASKFAIGEWQEQKRRNREYLKAHELVDEEGNTTSLEAMQLASNANPAIRRCELMVRIRGFENLADHMGCAGEFYTLTAPSKYHCTLHSGHKNRKWSGVKPSATQKYLCKVWSRIRAKLKRDGLDVFGFRVAEPHHDSTPHWHLLLFMRPEHVEKVREIFLRYALAEDGHEPGAEASRFKYEPIDKSKGGATGYIAKYISKNIDGYALDGEVDDDTGQPLREMARNVSAWAAKWRIRQFQQIGGAPVQPYRELRRLRENEAHDEIRRGFYQYLQQHSGLNIHADNLIPYLAGLGLWLGKRIYKTLTHDYLSHVRAEGEATAFSCVLSAADASDWMGYTQSQGGAYVKRDELIVRLSYEVKEQASQYGDDVQRINGVYCPLSGRESFVCTRDKQWTIVRKSKDESRDEVALNRPLSDSVAARSTVNNCTLYTKEPEKPAVFCPDDRKENRRFIRQLIAENEERESRRRRQRMSQKDERIFSAQDGELIKKMQDSGKLIGADIPDYMAQSMLDGSKIVIGEHRYYSSRGELVRERYNSRQRAVGLLRHIRDKYGAKTDDVLFDPVGEYSKMLKHADPIAWKTMFEPKD
ncbi:replication endonuclease [Limnobaculum xujianqingii]|uniref:replication endonuclease n=1 Tax=Limnobaculum xujianqingii TaxID=2738837 RepID=UPI001F356B22|nr:replication endonuclease [Limnobaculum xujianqingii]